MSYELGNDLNGGGGRAGGETHIFSSSGLEFSIPPARSSSRLDFVFVSIVRLEFKRAVRATALRLSIS